MCCDTAQAKAVFLPLNLCAVMKQERVTVVIIIFFLSLPPHDRELFGFPVPESGTPNVSLHGVPCLQ